MPCVHEHGYVVIPSEHTMGLISEISAPTTINAALKAYQCRKITLRFRSTRNTVSPSSGIFENINSCTQSPQAPPPYFVMAVSQNTWRKECGTSAESASHRGTAINELPHVAHLLNGLCANPLKQMWNLEMSITRGPHVGIRYEQS